VKSEAAAPKRRAGGRTKHAAKSYGSASQPMWDTSSESRPRQNLLP
jgi:hypothetical protein